MTDYFEIYRNQARQYDLLVAREDYRQLLPQALDQIHPFTGFDVVELGAGTGRLTCLLAPVVKTIRAYDSSQSMLDVAIEKLTRTGLDNWQVEIADHRDIPAESESADVSISGWSLCYLVVGNDKTWQTELQRGLAEMKRVLRKNGTLILIETLGTGRLTPKAPADLASYYAFLQAQGFQRKWIRTDYLFPDLEESQRLTRFFFGDAMTRKIRRTENGFILPECTGIWWQSKT